MERRAFMLGFGGTVLLPTHAIDGEQPGKVVRIGFLGGSPFLEVFRQGLRELGYVDGQNIAVEYRTWRDEQQLPLLVAELVSRKIDVLVAGTTQAAVAAKNATTAIPIVMVNVGDSVGAGLVASLARPGGNVTGLSRNTSDVTAKNLQLLKEIMPRAVRVAVLVNPTNASHGAAVTNARGAAASMRLELRILEAGSPGQLPGAFSAMAREHVSAVLILGDSMFFVERKRIADLALANRFPSIFSNTEHAEAGGLMSYAPNSLEPYRRAAHYVDKILKGAKPADLPVEQPTTFDFVINLKTAKALGLTIPPSLLGRADEVIQ